MANACVMIKKGLNADMGASLDLVDALSASGYSFDECYILSEFDKEKFVKLLNSLQKDGKTVFLLTDENVDACIKRLLMCQSKTDKQGVFRKLGATVYEFTNKSLEKDLVELLKAQKLIISVAESFTGGGIAKRITSVSGASEVYFEGLNVYNEASKIKRLGVSSKTLQEKGAVSQETAFEMARGLLNTGDCDVAIATTGLAGPNSDGSGKPVGLCYIAVGTKVDIQVHKYLFDGTRQEIVEKGIDSALLHACEVVKNYQKCEK